MNGKFLFIVLFIPWQWTRPRSDPSPFAASPLRLCWIQTRTLWRWGAPPRRCPCGRTPPPPVSGWKPPPPRRPPAGRTSRWPPSPRCRAPGRGMSPHSAPPPSGFPLKYFCVRKCYFYFYQSYSLLHSPVPLIAESTYRCSNQIVDNGRKLGRGSPESHRENCSVFERSSFYIWGRRWSGLPPNF